MTAGGYVCHRGSSPDDEKHVTLERSDSQSRPWALSELSSLCGDGEAWSSLHVAGRADGWNPSVNSRSEEARRGQPWSARSRVRPEGQTAESLETGWPAPSGPHSSASLPAVLAEPCRSSCPGISTLPRGGRLMGQPVCTLFFHNIQK